MANSLDQELFKDVLQLVEGRQAKASRITIEQYNKEIDEAIARVEAGEFYFREEAEQLTL
jgi:hypothetical protein